MKSAITIRLVCLAILFVSSPAVPAVFNCAITGHDYEFIPQTCNTSWTTARDEAGAADGYLVTVTTAAEQACLEANAVAGSWWTGGSDAAVEEVWEWVTGPEAGRQFWQGSSGGSATAPDNYANWFAGEPNSSSEDYMVWNAGGGFGWNDVGHTNPIVCGYLIEYEEIFPESVFKDGFETHGSGHIARIEVTPGGALFTAIDDSEALQARFYDDNGHLVPDTIFTWSSNDADTVSVDNNGVATAQAGLGSAQITASADGIVSPPVTVLVAEPVTDAVLIGDDEVVVSPTLVDLNADLGIGLQFITTLDGTTVLEVGDTIVGTGVEPIGGVVVAVEVQGDGSVIITYEVVPLDELFDNLLLDETYDLANVPFTLGKDAIDLYNLEDLGGGSARLTLKPETNLITNSMAVTGFTAQAATQASTKFMLGIFECEATASPPFTLTTNPGTITVTTTATLSVQIAVPIGWIPDVELARLDGEIRADFKAEISLTSNLSAEVKCEAANMINKTIPLAGPAFLLSPTVSMGPNIKLGGKIDTQSLGFELSAEAGANGFVEFRCPASNLSPCGVNAEFNAPTPKADYKVDVPNPDALLDIKIQPELGAGVTGKISFGLPPQFALVRALLGTLSIEAAKASLGLKQTGDLAFVKTQIDDESYASSYKLAYEWEAGPGEQVEQILNMLSSLFNLGPDLLKASGDGDLATSPKATSATADDDIFRAGDTVTFTVDLDPSTTDYPFFDYNVDHVKIYRKNDFGEPDEIKDVAATNNQTSFIIPWMADADGSISAEDYYAFVTTDALPVPDIGELELQKVSVPADVTFLSRQGLIDIHNQAARSRIGLAVTPTGTCDPGSDTDPRFLEYTEDAPTGADDTSWTKSGKTCGASWTASGESVGNSSGTVESFQYSETFDSDGKLRVSGQFKANATSDSGESVTDETRAVYIYTGISAVAVNVRLKGTYDVSEMTGNSRLIIEIFVGVQCPINNPSAIGVCEDLTASGSYDETTVSPAGGIIRIFAKFTVLSVSGTVGGEGESANPATAAGKFDFTLSITPVTGAP
jgi:hypothetical protein